MTKLLGVIGDPVAHSLSPLIHNHWIREAGFDATYEAIQIAAEDFAPSLAMLRAKPCMGFNVTLPHKLSAFAACSNLTDAAQKIGAVNTLTPIGETDWAGHNTDAQGFLDSLEWGGVDLWARPKTLVIGAGGAARAVVYALVSKGIYPTILNRTEARAKILSADLTGSKSVYGSIDVLAQIIDSSDLVINTVSAGHSGNILELPTGQNRFFVDISYGKAAAKQLDFATQHGWQTLDGLGLLVAQAALSFETWFDEYPPTDEILKRSRKLVETLT